MHMHKSMTPTQEVGKSEKQYENSKKQLGTMLPEEIGFGEQVRNFKISNSIPIEILEFLDLRQAVGQWRVLILATAAPKVSKLGQVGKVDGEGVGGTVETASVLVVWVGDVESDSGEGAGHDGSDSEGIFLNLLVDF